MAKNCPNCGKKERVRYVDDIYTRYMGKKDIEKGLVSPKYDRVDAIDDVNLTLGDLLVGAKTVKDFDDERGKEFEELVVAMTEEAGAFFKKTNSLNNDDFKTWEKYLNIAYNRNNPDDHPSKTQLDLVAAYLEATEKYFRKIYFEKASDNPVEREEAEHIRGLAHDALKRITP